MGHHALVFCQISGVGSVVLVGTATLDLDRGMSPVDNTTSYRCLLYYVCCIMTGQNVSYPKLILQTSNII